MANQNEEQTKNSEEALKNADIVREANALAQNDALNIIENGGVIITPIYDEDNSENVEENSDNQTVETPAETEKQPEQEVTSEEISPSAEQSSDVVEESVENESAPVAEEVTPVAEESAPIAEEPAEISEQSEEEIERENFEQLINEKFSEAIKDEKERLTNSIDEIKKSHPKDYDSYVEKLKNTKYYKKSLEKWTQYYSEIKEKCVNEVKNEIETVARDSAISVNKETTQEAPVLEKVALQSNNSFADASIQSNNQKEVVTPVQTLNPEPTVDEIQVDKYVSLASDGKMLVDKNLRKTVEEVLLDTFYASFDETSDFYNKLNAETNENKKDNKIVEFRNELANNLQQVHNKVFPNESKVYMPYVDSMQKDIENRNGNMNINSVSEQIFDRLYHIDTTTKQATGIIPSLADDFSRKIQDILIANDVLEFNLSKDNVEKILDRLVKESKLGEILQENSKKTSAIVVFTGILAEEIKKIRSGNVSYNSEEFAKYKNLLNEYKSDNSKNEQNYAKLEKIIENIESCEKILTENNENYKTNPQVRNMLKESLTELNNLKSNAKINESLNAKSDKKLMNETDKSKAISDYITANLIKKATIEFQNDDLKSFNYSEAEATKDLTEITEMLKIDGESKVITADCLDSINLMIQEFIVKQEKKYLENQEKIDAYLDEVTRFTAVLEEDEEKQESGNYTEEDAQKIVEDQKYAKVLITDFTHIQRAQNKKNLTNTEVENLDLRLVR